MSETGDAIAGAVCCECGAPWNTTHTTACVPERAFPRDSVVQAGRWRFDEDVTIAFDDMLRRSIPQYDVMRQSVFEVGRRVIEPHVRTEHQPVVVDLGASRGESLAPFVHQYGAGCRYVAVESSPPMLRVLRERFAGWIGPGVMTVRDHDLRTGLPPCARATLVLSVLTVQFVPIEHRRRILEGARAILGGGGAFIMVEKVTGRTLRLHDLMDDVHLTMKRENGYTAEQIARKQASLEGALVPLDAGQNYLLLRESGFNGVECFWRWMNFAAWVATT